MRLERRRADWERLLEVLEDGEWHSLTEIHEAAGHMIVHSRVADLRNRGYLVEHKTTGKGAGGSWYRLPAEPVLFNLEEVA